MRVQVKSTRCIHRPPLVSPPLLLRQSRSLWKLPWKLPWKFPWKLPKFPEAQRPTFEPIPKEPPKPRRSAPFDPDRKRPHTHRRKEEDNWVAMPMNGTIPVLIVSAIVWGAGEKWLRTLPCPNDGRFGPTRYADDPRAKHWGEYRRDIQPRQGRRHLDRGM